MAPTVEDLYWHKPLPEEAMRGRKNGKLTLCTLGSIMFLVNKDNIVEFVYTPKSSPSEEIEKE